MKMLSNTKKPKGLCFNGIKYVGTPSSPQIDFISRRTVPIKCTTSFVADQTTGYATTYSIDSSKQFKIFTQENWNEPLNYIPEHSFVLFYGEQTLITTITLVYDGNYLFHLEGTINNITYTDSKLGGTTGNIFMVDRSGNLFLTNISAIISKSTASSSTSTSYKSATISITYNVNTFDTHTIRDITLPYSIVGKASGSIYTSGEVSASPLFALGVSLTGSLTYEDVIL